MSDIVSLEQIRAKNAFAAANDKKNYVFAGREDGKSVAKKVPVQIIQNGFLGALAFACETKKDKQKPQNGDSAKQPPPKNPGHHAVFRAIIAHLSTIGADFGIGNVEPDAFLEVLAQRDASVLRAVTAEALAYLSYLRRFAHGDKEAEND